jgi:hypothetical protein
MSYRRNNTAGATTAATATTTHATRSARPAGQRSYIVSIDTGSFTNVEIVVGDYHHRPGVWTTPRADTVKVTSNKTRHVYAYGMLLASLSLPTDIASADSLFLLLLPLFPPTHAFCVPRRRITRHRIDNKFLVPTSPTTPTKQRSPFTPLQPQSASARSHSSSSTSTSASASDAWSKRSTYDYEREGRARDYTAARHHHHHHHHHLPDERSRARLQRQLEREEEARQRLAEAEARRAAAVAKEARRRQRLAEQQRHEEQKRQQALLREDRRRLERTRRAREIANAWSSYEKRWGLLSQSQNQRQLGSASLLTFERIPWPVADSEIIPPSPLDDRRRTRRGALDELLRPEAIREFLLSPAHSSEVSSKDRIRAALRRWHPDKFARLLGLVVESDRDDVADGVGIVVRCLNEMLERENHA